MSNILYVLKMSLSACFEGLKYILEPLISAPLKNEYSNDVLNVRYYALFNFCVLFAGETKFSVVQVVHPLTPPTEATSVEHVLVSLYYCYYHHYYYYYYFLIKFLCFFPTEAASNLWAYGVTGEEVTSVTVTFLNSMWGVASIVIFWISLVLIIIIVMVIIIIIIIIIIIAMKFIIISFTNMI